MPWTNHGWWFLLSTNKMLEASSLTKMRSLSSLLQVSMTYTWYNPGLLTRCISTLNLFSVTVVQSRLWWYDIVLTDNLSCFRVKWSWPTIWRMCQTLNPGQNAQKCPHSNTGVFLYNKCSLNFLKRSGCFSWTLLGVVVRG